MFTRFTTPTRQVVLAATEIAGRLGAARVARSTSWLRSPRPTTTWPRAYSRPTASRPTACAWP
jgi:hypothetical protein